MMIQAPQGRTWQVSSTLASLSRLRVSRFANMSRVAGSLLLGVALSAGPSYAREEAAKPVLVADLSWMTGVWRSESGAMIFEERWTDAEGGALLGVSKSISKGRMVFFEFFRIVEMKEGGVAYIAQPAGRPPTEFRLTKSAPGEVVFENPQHDHPKIIRYRKTPEGLTAEVEGDEGGKHVKQEFVFKAAPKS